MSQSGVFSTSGGGGGAVNSVTGTTNQITSSSTTGDVILSIPSTFIAPGTIASTTLLTAGNGFTVTTGTITLTPLNTIGVVFNSAAGVLSTSATTNHTVQLGNASGQLTSLANGTNGQVLTAVTGADPQWAAPSGGGVSSITGTANQITASASTGAITLSTPSTFIAPGTIASTTSLAAGNLTTAGIVYNTVTSGILTSHQSTNHAVQIGNSSGQLGDVSPSATTGVPLISQGSSSNPLFGTALVVGGGTGVTATTVGGILVGSSTTAFTNLVIGSNTFVLTSNGTTAAWAASTGGVTSITGTANQITASASTGAVTLSTPSTFIAPGTIASTTSLAAGNLTTAGIVYNSVTTGILTSHTTTNHAIQLGNGTQLADLALGTQYQVLQSGGAADPAWSAYTLPATVAQGDLWYASGTTAISSLAKSASSTRYLSNTGTTNNPAWAQVDLTNGVTGTLPVTSGGTGITATTVGGILVGSSTTAFTNLAIGSNTFVLTSNGTTAAWAAASGGSSFTWSIITADQTATTNNGYICNKGSSLLLTLPTASSVGDYLRVTGINTALGWKIAQAASQQIFFGTTSTTSGTGGSLQSSATRDAIELVCITANLTWQVLASIGNITVV